MICRHLDRHGGFVDIDNRLEIRTVASDVAQATFADDVRTGLLATPKALPPKYFYDALGSKLFEAICLLPEYYLTRAEREILERHAGEMLDAVGSPVEIVEFGSGSGEKSRLLFDRAFERQPTLHYLPVDISESALRASADAMLDEYPTLAITGYASDYDGAIAAMRDRERTGVRRLALFLGSNIGNLDELAACAFLSGVRATLDHGDALLLGADLRKDPDVLLDAYDDPLGVTAAFNLNLLGRINRELGGDFDLKLFSHVASWDDADGCMRIHLASLVEQTVEIQALGIRASFAEGETIHTEDSRKYDLASIDRLAVAAGFERVRTWTDTAGRFSSNLLVAGG
jgi:dimethylhistidine N-methyltransferase